MDILNALYLKAQGLIRTTAEPNSIVYISTPDPRRDDKFLTIAVPIENLAAVIGALETVAVDGITITGDGTPGNPLTVNIAGTGLVDSVTDDGLGGISVDNTDPENPILSFIGVTVDGITLTGDGTASNPLMVDVSALGLVDSVTDDGIGGVSVDNTDPDNPVISFTGVEVDGVTITGTGVVGDALTVSEGVFITYPLVKATFTQAEFATDPLVSIAPNGALLIVVDYAVSGFGGSFIRLNQGTTTSADWVVLSTDAPLTTGAIGVTPL